MCFEKEMVGTEGFELLQQAIEGPRMSTEEGAAFAEEVVATAHLTAAELVATAKEREFSFAVGSGTGRRNP
jgi:hypothetical protein